MKPSTNRTSPHGSLGRRYFSGVLAGIFCFVLIWSFSCKHFTEPLADIEPDTTSHNFTFETFVLGDGNSSQLYDVAIINDTLAYAVGEISVKDSTGHFINPPYNVAKWNGKKWELLTFMSDARILYPGSVGDSLLFVYGHAIFVTSQNDIWIAAGNLHHFNGLGWIQTQAEGAGFSNKIWVDNSGHLWCTGGSGTIIYFNGGSWRKIETGTTAEMRDVVGYTDPADGRKVVLSVASSLSITTFFSLKDGSAKDTLGWNTQDQLNSLWVSNKFDVYATGVGVWKYNSQAWESIKDLPAIFYNRIRGSETNNVFVTGRDILAHYNGASWYSYQNIPSDFRLKSVAVSENVVIAVGLTVQGGIFADKAAIIVGKRQN